MDLFNSTNIYIYIYIYIYRDKPRWGPMGVQAPLGPLIIIIIYIYSYNIFYLCNWAPFQNLRPSFSSINLTSLTQLATIQPKNLTKTIKTFTIVIVF